MFFSRTCPQHPESDLVFICLYQNCKNQRLICNNCLSTHKQHVEKIHGLQQMANLKSKKIIEEIDLIELKSYLDKVKSFAKLISKFSNSFEQLFWKKINSFIKEIRCASHLSQPITKICLNEECKNEKLMCTLCLQSHQQHKNDIYDANQVFEILNDEQQNLYRRWFNLFYSSMKNLQFNIIQIEDNLYFNRQIAIEEFNSFGNGKISQIIEQIVLASSNQLKKIMMLTKDCSQITRKIQINLLLQQLKLTPKQLLQNFQLFKDVSIKKLSKLSADQIKKIRLDNNGCSFQFIQKKISIKDKLRKIQQFNMNTQQNEEKLEKYNQRLKIDPQNIQALNDKGDILRECKKHDESWKCYCQILEIDKTNVKALFGLSESLRVLKRFEKSESYFETAQNINMNLAQALWFRNNSLMRMEYALESIKQYDKKMFQKPQYINQMLAISSQSLRNQNHFYESLEWCNIILAFDFENIKALLRKGECLRNFGNLMESIQCFEKILFIQFDNIEALWGKGEILRMQQKYSESLIYYDNALVIEPKFIKAKISKGHTLNSLNHLDESIALYNQVLKIEPQNIEALIGKGQSLSKLGLYKESMINLVQVISVDPLNAKGYCLLGDSLKYMGFQKESIVHLLQPKNLKNLDGLKVSFRCKKIKTENQNQIKVYRLKKHGRIIYLINNKFLKVIQHYYKKF